MVLGLSPRLEGEEMSVPVEGFRGGDRIELDLPRVQEDLLQKMVALGKPVVLVLLNGSAVAVNWARDHVPAIVEAWYPGQAGGTAIADVLFGDYNPAGRLPVTFYKSADQLPPFTDYCDEGPHVPLSSRASRCIPSATGSATRPSRTATWRCRSRPRRDATCRCGRGGEYGRRGRGRGRRGVREAPGRRGWDAHSFVAGFERIALAPHERKTVEITLPARQLADRATYEISAGGGQQPAASARLRIE